MRCINLLEQPDAGEILINGKDILKPGLDLDEFRANLGMVFQHFNLFPNMTVKENIKLAPVRLQKWTKEEADEKAVELLKRVGLEDKQIPIRINYLVDRNSAWQLRVHWQ